MTLDLGYEHVLTGTAADGSPFTVHIGCVDSATCYFCTGPAEGYIDFNGERWGPVTVGPRVERPLPEIDDDEYDEDD